MIENNHTPSYTRGRPPGRGRGFFEGGNFIQRSGLVKNKPKVFSYSLTE
jgi:hypothetical protein